MVKLKNSKQLKYLVIGLGSMGKRRIRNLLYLKVSKENIFGYDVRGDRNKEAEDKFGIRTYKTFNEAVKLAEPDAYIISTTADVHHKYFLHAAKNKKHFFVEHPVTDKGYKELLKIKDGSFVGAPSCTLQFHPGVKQIKKILDGKTIGKILSFQYYLGQYLPSWHPWEDYRDVYFSKKFTGACREMFGFELVWLTHALNLGKVSKIVGMAEKLSDLEMTSDDRYSALVKFENKVSGNIVIDLLSRKPFRTLRIIGSDGNLDWEWQENQIKIYKEKQVDNDSPRVWKIIDLKKGKSEKGYITTEDMYEEEIGHFLGAIDSKSKYPYTFEESLEHLHSLFALEKSSKGKKVISVR
jgi:predicted dehydrogenase